MIYKPIRSPGKTKEKAMLSFGPEEGENLNKATELLNEKQALKITNYLIGADGRFIKRKGYENILNITGNNPITLLEKYDDTNYIIGYSNKIAAFDPDSGSYAVIKSDFTTSDPFSGVRYGNYFFVCNGGDKIGRISRTLDYDNQTANFTVGAKLTGGTSGATATILEDSDSGETGTLTLGNIEGNFEDDETITDDGGTSGSATVNGTMGWNYTEISSAPMAKVLYTFGGRLFAGNLEEDDSAVRYSSQDTGTNPPFSSWASGTGATDPGKINFRSAGSVQAIGSIGEQIIVLYDNGKAGFRIIVIDSSGTLVQDTPIDFERLDFGGARGSAITPEGVFYANEAGIWQMVSGGDTNVPASAKERLISTSLGDFSEYDFSNADIIYSEEYDSVLITCSKNSDTNNLILVYNLAKSAWSEIIGWNIGRFLSDGINLFGGSSTNTKIYKLFSTDADDGDEIATEIYQEFLSSDPSLNKTMLKQYIKGFLSPSSNIKLRFDVYDANGKLKTNKAELAWQAEYTEDGVEGIGSGSWGSLPTGGDTPGENELIESLGGGSKKISNFTRLRVSISEQSILPHEINWLKIIYKIGSKIRVRNLAQV